MKTNGDMFIIKYDIGSIRKVDIGGVEIEIAAECNTDVRGNQDQIGVIHAVPNGHNFFKKGDTVVTHYLSSHESNSFEHEGVIYHRVPLRSIFFKINEDGTFEMKDNVYLCDEIVIEAPKSPSGIFLTPYEDKREPLRLKVLKAPKTSREIKEGDKIISQDDYQYTLTYNKRKYVKIDYEHILATYE